MSLATLFKMPVTPADFAEWTFSNMTDHNDIAASIKRKFGVVILKFVLEPVTEAGLQAFLLGHQAMHTQEATLLGVDNQDFLSADFTAWYDEHADQHRRERAALGM